MQHPKSEELAAEATQLIRRAIELGIQMERARLRSLLSGDVGVTVDPSSVPITAPTPRRGRGLARSGPIAMVRKALAEMAISSAGIDTGDVHGHLARTIPEVSITLAQVRGALKNLVNTGEARQPSRGRYLPIAAPESADEEKSGDDESPDPFQLAAE